MQNNFKHKKSLGQHFLVNNEICKNIVEALPQTDGAIIEIGPGTGALTQFLVLKKNPIYCIDVDDRLATIIPNKFPTIHFIHKDFLQLDLATLFQEPISVIGNFPYNISTEIVFKIIEQKHLIKDVVGMFQKEVAQRFAATHGNKIYGVTSVLAQAYFKVNYLFEIDASNFDPPPKVQSAVISMQALDKPYNIENPKFFKTIVKAAFNQRRKTLRNALKPFLQNHTLDENLLQLRAERLSVQDFVDISNALLLSYKA